MVRTARDLNRGNEFSRERICWLTFEDDKIGDQAQPDPRQEPLVNLPETPDLQGSIQTRRFSKDDRTNELLTEADYRLPKGLAASGSMPLRPGTHITTLQEQLAPPREEGFGKKHHHQKEEDTSHAEAVLF